MKYVVLLDALQNKARIIRCLNDAEVLDTCYNLIGCDTIQLVPLWPDRLEKGFAAVCDEDTFGKVPVINPLASWLYGADQHGQPITRNALIWKTVPDDFDFMSPAEAHHIADLLNKSAEEIFTKVLDGISKGITNKDVSVPATP